MPETHIDTDTDQACPACHQSPLIRVESGPLWCEACEWNLQAPQEKMGWLSRRAHRLAFSLNSSSLDGLVAQPSAPSRWAASSLVLMAVSAVLALGMAASIGLGLDLLLTRGFGFKLLGVLFVLIGIELRPRMGRLDRSLGLTDRSQAPELFAIVDEVAAALAGQTSTKPVKINLVVLDESFNAWCGRFGLRQRPVLGLGLPLWGSLSAEARVALLGHELGHLVTGDPARGLLSQPAVTTFFRLADMFDPRGLYLNKPFLNNRSQYRLTELFARIASYLLFTPLYHALRWVGYLLSAVAARDHSRAEFCADRLALAVGGTDGARELFAMLLFKSSVRTAIRRTGSADPLLWQAAAAQALRSNEPSLRRAEQYSMRVDASLLGSHPPAGLRMRAVQHWPQLPAGLVVAPQQFAAADAEFTNDYQRIARALAAS